MVKLCNVCWKNKAEVPDRNRGGRPIKRVCGPCHEGRLRQDLSIVFRAMQPKKMELSANEQAET